MLGLGKVDVEKWFEYLLTISGFLLCFFGVFFLFGFASQAPDAKYAYMFPLLSVVFFVLGFILLFFSVKRSNREL